MYLPGGGLSGGGFQGQSGESIGGEQHRQFVISGAKGSSRRSSLLLCSVLHMHASQ